MMDISATVIITNGSEFLVSHPTQSPWKRCWSLPKGIIDEGETPEEAAIREVQEETGITLAASRLVDHGVFKYKRTKDLHMFVYEVDAVNIANLKCSSFFKASNGKRLPEVDKFAWIKVEKAQEYLNPGQWKIFKEIIS